MRSRIRIAGFSALLVFLACLLAPLAHAGVAIEHWVSPGGGRVYFVSLRALPILDVQIDFAAGSMFDPPGKSGTAALTYTLLDLGAGKLDENAIADRLADVGANLGGGADMDRASISLRTLSASNKRGPALEIVRGILAAPRFDQAVFEREKARTIASLKESLTRPDTIALRAFWTAMYPAHAYGGKATPESLAAITRDDLLAFHRKHYRARNAIVTLVGDISREEAERIAEELLAAMPGGEPPTLPAVPTPPAKTQLRIPHPATQAQILVGLPAIERTHPDYFALRVGNYTLGGGGFVSRLMKEVRIKHGYAYHVYSYFQPLRQAGPFQLGLQTKRGQADEALKTALSVLQGFLDEGPSADELAAAKANLIGSFPLLLDGNRKILGNVANIAFHGLPLDYLDTYRQKLAEVTAEQVRQAFARHVRPGNMVTVIVAAD